MEETYCIKDKKYTPCVEPSGFQTDKNGRGQFYCHCAICGIKKVRYVKNGKMGMGKKTGNGKKKKKQLNFQGKGIATDIGGVAADAFIHYGVPWMAKKLLKLGDMVLVN